MFFTSHKFYAQVKFFCAEDTIEANIMHLQQMHHAFHVIHMAWVKILVQVNKDAPQRQFYTFLIKAFSNFALKSILFIFQVKNIITFRFSNKLKILFD